MLSPSYAAAAALASRFGMAVGAAPAPPGLSLVIEAWVPQPSLTGQTIYYGTDQDGIGFAPYTVGPTAGPAGATIPGVPAGNYYWYFIETNAGGDGPRSQIYGPKAAS